LSRIYLTYSLSLTHTYTHTHTHTHTQLCLFLFFCLSASLCVSLSLCLSVSVSLSLYLSISLSLSHYHSHSFLRWIYGDQILNKTHDNIKLTKLLLQSPASSCGWEDMLKTRPRVRVNGIYSLLTSYWKNPSRDAFWEERSREIIEVKFYRHMRFMRNKKVL